MVKSIFIPPSTFEVPTARGTVHGVCFLGRVGLAYEHPTHALAALKYALTWATARFPLAYVGVDP